MTYPTDVHQEDAWPNGWGELTQVNIFDLKPLQLN